MDIGDPALRTAGLAALEGAINRALKLDSAALRRIEALQGQVFHLQCTSPALDCYVAPGRGGVRLMGHWEGDCETTISGAASDFAELAGAADPAAALINGDLALEGDSAPLLELQGIITSLDVDWEAPLVDTLGDVVGHQVAEGLRGLSGWGKGASTNLVRQLSEFLQEEARLSPPRLEVEDFYKDLERLNLRLDRLAARLRKLGGGSANR
jgi:ubiquinone biosynthesis protein UbiJ